MANFSKASLNARRWLLAAALAASVLASLDLFVVNLAFASISASFPTATPQTMSWILNAYGITFAALLVPAGRLADRFGALRLFRAGLGLFTLGSLLAALAPGIGLLIFSRGMQGLGAAMVVPTSLALLLARHPRGQHKRMVSLWGASGSVAAAAGPVLGGLLSEHDWRWIFLVNVPLAAFALFSTRRVEKDLPVASKTPDLLGVALLALGIGALVTALSYASDWGMSSPWLWFAVAVSGGAAAWFIRRCRVHGTPAMDLGVFRERTFSVAALGMAGFYIGFAVMLLGGSLFLTHVQGWSPTVAGLGFAVGPGTAVVAALAAGRTSLAPRWLAALGGAFFVAGGTLWYFLLDGQSPYFPVFFVGLILTGAGAGIAQTGFLSAGVGGLRAEFYAAGTGALNTSRQIGSTLGVAVLIVLTGAGTDGSSYQAAWLVMACAGFVGALSALLMRPWPGRRDGVENAGAAADVQPANMAH